jgi:hypothetical protein
MKWLPLGEILFFTGVEGLVYSCLGALLGLPTHTDFLLGFALTIVGWKVWRRTLP